MNTLSIQCQGCGERIPPAWWGVLEEPALTRLRQAPDLSGLFVGDLLALPPAEECVTENDILSHTCGGVFQLIRERSNNGMA